ncbi:hypothetical protein P154DRAFT_561261 [Amniculicola lignicola CBS 123094]|uniref:Zn(2)-C6 fungal-type domain-containing protein n=1 Tax=Amniculicola lignicola CBS 123094 TaxID=1392246 RepID=A0A6A5WPJ6_9PLEO|nr:hypothetical protein P154DRAFT_561261 [Amniculicola lignicola CBS 123094]
MESAPSKTEKLLRVQSNRSSSGCRTCKQRRLKCGEERPYCQRCLKSNKICSYAARDTSPAARKFVVYTEVPRPLPQTPDLEYSEKRSLHYFRCQAALQMAQPFTSGLWTEHIYRLADSHEFVMSALTALSTLHESYIQAAEARDHLQLLADTHYSKALRDIGNADASDLSTEAVLAASLIFYSLESLRGSFHRALQHAYSGVKIIRDKWPLSRTSGLSEELYRTFLSLQNQVKELSESTTKRAYDTIEGFDPPISDQFSSVEEAHHHLDIIHNEFFSIGHYVQHLQESGQDIEEIYMTDIAPRFEKAQERFTRWSYGIQHLQQQKHDVSERLSQSYLLLKIWGTVFKATLESITTAECFNTYDPDLVEALEIIEIFLANETNPPSNGSNQGYFSLCSGVIPILFMIAWRSNNEAIREKSMHLLRMSKRREGLWDSKLVLRLAEHAVALKGRLAANGVGDGHSVQIELRFSDEKTCEMTCVYLETNYGGQTMMPLEGTGRERRHVELIGFESL